MILFGLQEVDAQLTNLNPEISWTKFAIPNKFKIRTYLLTTGKLFSKKLNKA